MATEEKKLKKRKPAVGGKKYETVLLEFMRDEIKAIGEGQKSFKEAVNRRFDEMDKKIDTETGILKQAIMSNTHSIEELKVATKSNTDAIQELKVSNKSISELLAINTEDIRELKVNSKVTLEYLIHIDERLDRIEADICEIKSEIEEIKKNKSETKMLGFLEKRVEKLEEEVKKYKTLFRQSSKNRT